MRAPKGQPQAPQSLFLRHGQTALIGLFGQLLFEAVGVDLVQLDNFLGGLRSQPGYALFHGPFSDFMKRAVFGIPSERASQDAAMHAHSRFFDD